MSTVFSRSIAWLAGAGGFFLALGGSAQAVQSARPPIEMPPPVYRPLPVPAPRPAPAPSPAPAPRPAPTPGGGGGGGGGGSVAVGGSSGEALPDLAWYALDEGLAKGRQDKRPVIVVFTTPECRAPGTFEHIVLRELLVECRAVPVKVLPPPAPAVAAGTPAAEQRALQEKHQAALKSYRELALKYGAGANPTVVFLTPGGEALGALHAPSVPQVKQWLMELPKTVKTWEDLKARAACAEGPAQPARPAPAPAAAGAAGAVGMIVPQELYPDTAPQPLPGKLEKM
ncbi:MAG TPA: hypothetical protein PK280_03935 [Planctomycetota bacterium]|nr:hypothetical protein [Planctomycetota bacterium]